MIHAVTFAAGGLGILPFTPERDATLQRIDVMGGANVTLSGDPSMTPAALLAEPDGTVSELLAIGFTSQLTVPLIGGRTYFISADVSFSSSVVLLTLAESVAT